MEIIELGPDEKIDRPGFYRIPLAQHHDQPTVGVSVTSSILRTMELGTPADVWAFHKLNPDRFEPEETDALRMGRAMAAFVEGGEDELAKHFKRHPADKPKRPTAQQVAAYDKGTAKEAGIRSVEYWRAVEADPAEYVTDEQWELLLEAGKVLAHDPAASAALGGEPEVTMAWHDEANDLWVLSRPDNVNRSGLLADYKRSAPLGYFDARWCDQQITKFAIDMQISLACEAFEHLTGEWPDGGVVFQMAKRPHHVLLRGIDDEILRLAQWRNARQRRRFRECLDSGYWPGPGEHVGSYSMPSWLFERLQEERQQSTAPEGQKNGPPPDEGIAAPY